MLDPPRRGDKLPHGWEFGNGPEGAELSRARRLVSVSVAAGILLAGIGALVLACRGKLRADQVPWAAAALISLGVAASPISWTHYQVLQYPGLALLLHHALRRRAWMLSGATLVLGGLLYPLPVAVLRAYYRQFGAWTAASPATLYVWTSVAPLAALVLFGVLLWQVKRAVEPRPAR
jgi:hypothetical protein